MLLNASPKLMPAVIPIGETDGKQDTQDFPLALVFVRLTSPCKTGGRDMSLPVVCSSCCARGSPHMHCQVSNYCQVNRHTES